MKGNDSNTDTSNGGTLTVSRYRGGVSQTPAGHVVYEVKQKGETVVYNSPFPKRGYGLTPSERVNHTKEEDAVLYQDSEKDSFTIELSQAQVNSFRKSAQRKEDGGASYGLFPKLMTSTINGVVEYAENAYHDAIDPFISAGVSDSEADKTTVSHCSGELRQDCVDAGLSNKRGNIVFDITPNNIFDDLRASLSSMMTLNESLTSTVSLFNGGDVPDHPAEGTTLTSIIEEDTKDQSAEEITLTSIIEEDTKDQLAEETTASSIIQSVLSCAHTLFTSSAGGRTQSTFISDSPFSSFSSNDDSDSDDDSDKDEVSTKDKTPEPVEAEPTKDETPEPTKKDDSDDYDYHRDNFICA